MGKTTIYSRHFDTERKAVLARIAKDGREIQMIVSVDDLASVDPLPLENADDFESAFDRLETKILDVAQHTLESNETIPDGGELIINSAMLR